MADVNVAGQLDEIEKRIMAGLKDFQRATVRIIGKGGCYDDIRKAF